MSRDVSRPVLTAALLVLATAAAYCLASLGPRGAHADPARRTFGPPPSRARSPGPANPANVMWDILVHAQDIAIPLGIDFPTPPRAGAAAATRIWELRWPFSFGAKRRLGSFALTATDADWTIGTGPEIARPDLRDPAPPDRPHQGGNPLLTGDGVHSLATF